MKSGLLENRRGGLTLTLVTGVVVLVLAGCASTVPAPVTERLPEMREQGLARPATVPEAQRPGYYTVKKGDTLYAIALDSGQDYKDVAAWNSLDNPNLIRVGQELRVAPPDGAAPVAETRPVSAPAKVERVESRPLTTPTGSNTETFKREPRGGTQPYSDQAWAQLQQREAANAPVVPQGAADQPAAPVAALPPAPPAVAAEAGVDWAWPAPGRMVAGYSEDGNKGIDIAGAMGQPVLAAAAGKVTLVSNALRGYGNLVVIKHNTTYLSVYAHNSKILVKEGQTVARGQQIAEIGNSDAPQPGLHFEIRRMGKPVDPLQFLPRR